MQLIAEYLTSYLKIIQAKSFKTIWRAKRSGGGHSTISRTRGLFGEEVFLSLFQQVLKLCVDKGMVRGKRQAVHSAFIKANASMDSLLEKEVLEDASAYVGYLEENS